MTQSVMLQIDHVTRQFSPHQAPAVHQVSLTLKQGDLIGLLGSSGCGKTTLLRLIAGFERPQTGTIQLNGQRVSGEGVWIPPERRDIGMVFQDYALFPHLTVAKNVAFGLTHRQAHLRYSHRDIRKLVQEAITQVGLRGMEERYPHQLSGGQQQRVALARALAPRPALILLDEPLSNLDAQVRLRLRQEIRHILKETGLSAVFVTHDQEEALSIADRIAVMQHGQIEQIGSPEDIYQMPSSRFVAEFVTQANFLPAVFNGHAWETEVGTFTPPDRVAVPTATRGEAMIRQEDVQLVPDTTAPVVVCDRQFLGREQRYCLQTASGHELHARAETHVILPVGTRVRLSVANSAVRIFPHSKPAANNETLHHLPC